jgi:hypothetical protein
MNIIKHKSDVWIALILSILLTIIYLIFSWHLAVLWIALAGDPIHTSQFSIFGLNPTNWSSDNPILFWHVLAIISLLINGYWAFKRVGKTQNMDKLLLPIVCHSFWIVCCVLLHLAAGMASFIYLGTVLG